mgnify:CR=1 FL=1
MSRNWLFCDKFVHTFTSQQVQGGDFPPQRYVYCHQSLSWFRVLWSANDGQGDKTANQDCFKTNCYGGPLGKSEIEQNGKALALFLKLFLVFLPANMAKYAKLCTNIIMCSAIAPSHLVWVKKGLLENGERGCHLYANRKTLKTLWNHIPAHLVQCIWHR